MQIRIQNTNSYNADPDPAFQLKIRLQTVQDSGRKLMRIRPYKFSWSLIQRKNTHEELVRHSI
jgi:hypothetical protein